MQAENYTIPNTQELADYQIDIILDSLEQKANVAVKNMRVPDNSWGALKQNALELYRLAEVAELMENKKNA